MEIERATDYEIAMLLVHRPDTQVSSMARSLKQVSVVSYSSYEDLERAIRVFLPRIT